VAHELTHSVVGGETNSEAEGAAVKAEEWGFAPEYAILHEAQS